MGRSVFLSKQYGVPSVNLESIEIPQEVLKLVTRDVVTRHQVIPLNKTGNTLMVAMADPVMEPPPFCLTSNL